MKKKRIIFITCIIVIFVVCYVFMNRSYDPLNRYAYDDENARGVIKQKLNDEEISYIVDYQIDPVQFIRYIYYPRFNIYHIDFYNAASQYLYNLNDKELVDIIERLISINHNNKETYYDLMGKSYFEILNTIGEY